MRVNAVLHGLLSERYKTLGVLIVNMIGQLYVLYAIYYHFRWVSISNLWVYVGSATAGLIVVYINRDASANLMHWMPWWDEQKAVDNRKKRQSKITPLVVWVCVINIVALLVDTLVALYR